MKKIIYTLLLCGTLTSTLRAQDYTVTPTNTDTVVAAYNQLSIFEIYQVNNASNSIILKWERISVNVPVGWDYALCDFGTCYTGIPPSGTMDTIVVGGMGLLGLNINPYSVSGQGVVKLYVYQDGFYSNGDTITWVVNAGYVSVASAVSAPVASVYPNPASEAAAGGRRCV